MSQGLEIHTLEKNQRTKFWILLIFVYLYIVVLE